MQFFASQRNNLEWILPEMSDWYPKKRSKWKILKFNQNKRITFDFSESIRALFTVLGRRCFPSENQCNFHHNPNFLKPQQKHTQRCNKNKNPEPHATFLFAFVFGLRKLFPSIYGFMEDEITSHKSPARQHRISFGFWRARVVASRHTTL